MAKRLELVSEDKEVYCFEVINDKLHITLNWKTLEGELMTERMMELPRPLIHQLKEFLNQI